MVEKRKSKSEKKKNKWVRYYTFKLLDPGWLNIKKL